MKLLLIFSALFGVSYWFYEGRAVGNNDLYVNRFVYAKSDNQLFNGTLETTGGNSKLIISFCDGIPCGEYEEKDNAGYLVTKGKYLPLKETLPDSTLKMLLKDTVAIDYWQEGGAGPYTLSIRILRDTSFFRLDKKKYDGYCQNITNSVMNDTIGHSLKYSYLEILFVDALFDYTTYYSKEYKIEGGKLNERASKEGTVGSFLPRQ